MTHTTNPPGQVHDTIANAGLMTILPTGATNFPGSKCIEIYPIWSKGIPIASLRAVAPLNHRPDDWSTKDD